MYGKPGHPLKHVCKLCDQKISTGGGTTNLKNHLESKHVSEYEALYSAQENINDAKKCEWHSEKFDKEATRLPKEREIATEH